VSELVPDGFPFPLAEPKGEPMMVTRPCGCTSMVIDGTPVQVSWCVPHDPGYTPPEREREAHRPPSGTMSL